MFKGLYRHRIDPKGRIPVPAPFRKALGASTKAVIVTLLDQCLAAYPPEEWSRLEGQLSDLPAFNRGAKALTRLITSRATDCAFDVQGRIRLPAPLRLAVGLEKEAVVVGVLNRFEIWAPQTWDSFLKESETLLSDASLGLDWPPSPPRPSGHPQGKPSR